MKKIIVLLLFPMALFAQKDKKIDWDELPQKAQTFLKTNFTKEKAQQILKETEDYLETIYQVTFQGKLKIKFDKNGNWKEVDGHRKPIPTRFIPEKILTYIKKSFPNNEVVKIEKEKKKYEVEISNGLELEFDREGNFLRIDS
ncbi:hypothetical protein Lbys_0099 [Leadbetterella byssophila DSM 17132]|uniref:Putative beta-lactamase-inhibitor-like PepSY-like domain-containing protein n=1 Tax=Leadbetterella byssophila (strain DSM 17132 / JCM 16389 / KACC 11308 / NBRC 106382 / 4M15) TaxID=649349 RepID=E4RSP5_LEAB4|nr:PepSY-like domain-containing protein [Leadbetterella byssophila]ADQ15895.1 hypothetical protein Lbys_0099 [Leadbetterella byssophila DSM 17132]